MCRSHIVSGGIDALQFKGQGHEAGFMLYVIIDCGSCEPRPTWPRPFSFVGRGWGFGFSPFTSKAKYLQVDGPGFETIVWLSYCRCTWMQGAEVWPASAQVGRGWGNNMQLQSPPPLTRYRPAQNDATITATCIRAHHFLYYSDCCIVLSWSWSGQWWWWL